MFVVGHTETCDNALFAVNLKLVSFCNANVSVTRGSRGKKLDNRQKKAEIWLSLDKNTTAGNLWRSHQLARFVRCFESGSNYSAVNFWLLACESFLVFVCITDGNQRRDGIKMSYDKLKFAKQDNKQLGRKALRLMQLNLRFCIFLSLFLITVILIVRLNGALYNQPKHLTLHQYVRNFFNDPYRLPLKNSQSNDSDDEAFAPDEFDLIWNEDTIELFQDQLGVIIDDDGDASKSLTCTIGEDFVVSSLPGVNDENLSDILWQYVSLVALESQSVQHDNGKRLSLKAFVTEQMRTRLNELFEGWESLHDVNICCWFIIPAFRCKRFQTFRRRATI